MEVEGMKARSGKWLVVPLAAVLMLSVACSKSSSGGGNGGGAGATGAGATGGGGGLVTTPPGTETSVSTPAGTGGGDLVGTWTGTWKNANPDTSEGTFTMQLTQQQGPLASGTITIAGSSCLTDGDAVVTTQGGQIAISVASGGTAGVTYTGTESGTTMQGSFADTCGASGSWQATKS
jgi:hypothetical protein